MQNRLLLVEVKNVLIQIGFNAKSTSTSRGYLIFVFREQNLMIWLGLSVDDLRAHGYGFHIRVTLPLLMFMDCVFFNFLALLLHGSVFGNRTHLKRPTPHTNRQAHFEWSPRPHQALPQRPSAGEQPIGNSQQEIPINIYIYYIYVQNRLLLVEVENVLIQIDFNAKSTSTSRSENWQINSQSSLAFQGVISFSFFASRN